MSKVEGTAELSSQTRIERESPFMTSPSPFLYDTTDRDRRNDDKAGPARRVRQVRQLPDQHFVKPKKLY